MTQRTNGRTVTEDKALIDEIRDNMARSHVTEFISRMKELGFTKEQAWDRFGFLMGAFKYGTPPHGGMAYGFDRMVMLIAGLDNIREVIAFPKVQNASELMSNAPDVIDDKQIAELHIELAKEE